MARRLLSSFCEGLVMAAAPLLLPPSAPPQAARNPDGAGVQPLYSGVLVLATPRDLVKGRSATLTLSVVLHALLVLGVAFLPLLWENEPPLPTQLLRAFFVAPPVVTAPPPPPPPPAAVARLRAQPPPVVRSPEPTRFVAPLEVPEAIAPEEGLHMGVEGGVPGGVEGGVPGGVVGGVVGGLLGAEPPSPPPVVRVGGKIHPPKLVHRVDPEYPPLAIQARVSTLIILEAQVGVDGRVKSVRVLRGHPLFDDAAMAAVKQWRYQPLLLNGLPIEFILTVTVTFRLQTLG